MGKTSCGLFFSRFLLASLIGGTAVAGTLGRELRNLSPNRKVQVIVQYSKISGANGAEASFPSSARKIADLPNGGVFSMTAGEAALVAGSTAVTHVSSAARTVYSTSGPVYDFTPETIRQSTPSTPNYNAGAGIGVVIVDSGINANLDLLGKVIYSENFSSEADLADHFGHGTHVAGLIAGNGISSLFGYAHDIYGVSPGALLINLKVLNAQGASTDGQVILAINRAVQLKKQHPEWNIKVMNLSLGRPIYEESWKDPLCQAVEAAWLNGITVIVAAGNEGRLNVAHTQGYGTITSPGNDPLAITVGAINTQSQADRSDDIMTSYSSKGPTLVEHTIKPDLVAPGNKLFSVLSTGSTLATQPYSVLVPGPWGLPASYLVLSGTSMAAAVTSGSAAAVLANEDLTPDQVKARLMKTAYKLSRTPSQIPVYDPATRQTTTYTVENDMFTVGAGLLDLGAALAAKGNPNFTIPAKDNAASPVAVPKFNKDGSVSVNVKNYLAVYGKDVFTVWGSDAFTVWGSDAFTVWGSDAFTVWGSDTDAFTVWGSTAVWGKDAFTVWGSDAFTVWGSDADAFTVWGSDAFTVWGSSGAFNTLWSQDAFTVWGSDADAFTVWGSGPTNSDPTGVVK